MAPASLCWAFPASVKLPAYQGKGDTKMRFPNNEPKLREGISEKWHIVKKMFLPLQRAFLLPFGPWERAPGWYKDA